MSAYEKLRQRSTEEKAQDSEASTRREKAAEPQSEASKLIGAMAKSAAHANESQVGRQIIRDVLGSILGSSRK